MTKKTHNDKHKNEWIWEETPETIQALKELHETSKRVNDLKFVKKLSRTSLCSTPRFKEWKIN